MDRDDQDDAKTENIKVNDISAQFYLHSVGHHRI
jgi:hypothetical protein